MNTKVFFFLLLRSDLLVVCLHSYSLEGLSGGRDELRGSPIQGPQMVEASRLPRQDSEDKGSLVSLTEEQEEQEDHGGVHDPVSRCAHSQRLQESDPHSYRLEGSSGNPRPNAEKRNGFVELADKHASCTVETSLCLVSLWINEDYQSSTSSGGFIPPTLKLFEDKPKILLPCFVLYS